MKFRYKVLITNMIIISICLATIGFFMIKKNFNLALSQQIENSIEENNLFQASIEYELLSIMSDSFSSENLLTDRLGEAGENVFANLSVNNSNLYIAYNNKTIFSSATEICDSSLWENTDVGKKNYTIIKSKDKYYIYVTSCTLVLDKRLNIINQRDITTVYTMMQSQSNYYKLLLLFVLIVCSIIMYIISLLLTRPLEKLQQVSESFGQGNYNARTNIKSKDEVGKLAQTYNSMADSVKMHMEELQGMVTRQEQFVADFTHELKTPMTSIIGYADTIRSRELTREQQIMAASYIFSEGSRLESMSMKLFEYIYTKKQNITPKKLNVRQLMEEVKSSITPMMDAKNIELVCKAPSCYINGDIDLLKSAFINLLDNGRKASSEGSKILFTCKQDSSNAVISVRDFGIGIPEDSLEKICDAFYMVDKSRSRKEGGAGLGLSLAALIFNSHNATMDISSTLGEGTEFKISFPLYQQEVITNA